MDKMKEMFHFKQGEKVPKWIIDGGENFFKKDISILRVNGCNYFLESRNNYMYLMSMTSNHDCLIYLDHLPDNEHRVIHKFGTLEALIERVKEGFDSFRKTHEAVKHQVGIREEIVKDLRIVEKENKLLKEKNGLLEKENKELQEELDKWIAEFMI
jgi:hypothetical protein